MLKSIIRNLPSNMKVRGRLTNRGELIAEVAIDGFKPLGKLHATLPMFVKSYNPIINILYLGQLDK